MSINKAHVKINGQRYTISGDRDPAEIEKIAQYVDDKIKYIMMNSNQGSAFSTIILAAVNIADELFETTKLLKREQDNASRKDEEAAEFARQWEDAKRELATYKSQVKEERETADIVREDHLPEDRLRIKALESALRDMEEKCVDLMMENTALQHEIDRIKAGEDTADE